MEREAAGQGVTGWMGRTGVDLESWSRREEPYLFCSFRVSQKGPPKSRIRFEAGGGVKNLKQLSNQWEMSPSSLFIYIV